MMYTGLGGSQQTGLDIAIGGTAAGAAVATGVAIGAIGGPVGMAIGAGIGLVTTILGSLFGGGRGGAQKVASTNIVNQVEPILKQNLAAYMNGSHSAADQAAALSNFDYAWSQVVQACSNPELGDAGKNCIADRAAGSTKGYDWFALYRDPIANDPNVQSVSATVTSDLSAVLSPASGGSSLIPLLLFGALALAVLD